MEPGSFGPKTGYSTFLQGFPSATHALKVPKVNVLLLFVTIS